MESDHFIPWYPIESDGSIWNLRALRFFLFVSLSLFVYVHARMDRGEVFYCLLRLGGFFFLTRGGEQGLEQLIMYSFMINLLPPNRKG